jgi:cytochrome P450
LLSLLVGHRHDPLGYLLHCAREDGDVVVFSLGGSKVLVLNEPALIQDVLVKRAREFRKGHFLQARNVPWARAILGRGLLMLDGDEWLRARRLMQPAFHRERIVAHTATMVEALERMVASWPKGEPREISADIADMTLEAMARAIFSSPAAVPGLSRSLHGVFSRRRSPGLELLIPEWVPTPANVSIRRSIGELDRIIHRLIRDRRASPDPGTDLLGLLLAARYEDGSAMTDREVRDHLMSTVVAGHDTLASTVVWTLDTLTKHPAISERLAAELRETLGPAQPHFRDLDRLPYLGAVAQEALRLYPPGRNIVRSVVTESLVGGRRVPAGSFLVMSQWVVHRDPRYYEAPDRFEPERWLEGLAARLPRSAFFPFGAGPRLCLGQAFAETMLRLALAVVTQRVALARVDGRQNEWNAATLRPRRGIWLRPDPRPA